MLWLCVESMVINRKSDTPDHEVVGVVYKLLGIIRARVEGVPLTSLASCDLEVVEVQTLDTRLLIYFSLVHD